MKIFIVEDSALMCARIAEAAISIAGIEVAGHSGDMNGALSGIRDSLPDVLVVDIQLHDGNGLTILKKVKNERPEIKAVVLSNSANTPYRQAALVAGADHFLDKSTEFSQLNGILADWQLHLQTHMPIPPMHLST